MGSLAGSEIGVDLTVLGHLLDWNSYRAGGIGKGPGGGGEFILRAGGAGRGRNAPLCVFLSVGEVGCNAQGDQAR